MQDGEWLGPEDKLLMDSLKQELVTLKEEHKKFARNKGGLTPEDREKWRKNSQRTNEVFIAIKDLRHKNILEAARG